MRANIGSCTQKHHQIWSYSEIYNAIEMWVLARQALLGRLHTSYGPVGVATAVCTLTVGA